MRALLPVVGLAVLLASGPGRAQDTGEFATEEELLQLGEHVRQVIGEPAGPPLEPATADAVTDELSKRMRCPVCQGMSVGESPSESARNMKHQVRAMIAAGYDEDQVFLYFETTYGEFIRLEPRAEGLTLWVWVLPLLALLAGGVVATGWLRGAKTPPAPAERAPGDAAEEAPEDPWLAQVRAETGGDDG